MCIKVLIVGLLALACNAVTTAANAGMAEHVSRGRVGGIDLVTYPMPETDVVTLAGVLPAGDYFADRDTKNPAIATLTAIMLERGTARRDKFAIAKDLESVGATLEIRVGTQSVAISGKALRKDVPRLVAVLAEELREPAFAKDEFEKAKKELAGQLQAGLENTDARAQEAFLLAAYSQGHPNRPVAMEEWIRLSGEVTLDDIKTFYRKYYGPAYLTLAFVGDIDEPVIRDSVKKSFSGWSGGQASVRSAQHAQAKPAQPLRISIADKTSVSVVLGQGTGLRYSDPDALALRVGTAVLGSGFTSRLVGTVRDREGLTYHLGAAMSDDELVDGVWFISGTFAPALLDRGIASIHRELDKWWSAGITPEELTLRKTNLVGTYEVGLSTTSGVAGAIMNTLLRGKPLSWLDEYPKQIDGLSVEQVNAAIHRYLDPKNLIVVEAGTFAPLP